MLNAETVRAAQWLAEADEAPHPIVPSLRKRFSLSVKEACDAIREASLIRSNAHRASTVACAADTETRPDFGADEREEVR